MLAFHFARQAVRDSVRKSLFSEVLKASLIVGKLTVKIIDCVPQMFRDCLTAIHGKNSMPSILLVVKGYLPGGGWGYQRDNNFVANIL